MFQIVDTITRETLGPNQSGELCIKGDHVMLGYANQKEASEQAFDDDGWLLTGMYYSAHHCISSVRLFGKTSFCSFQMSMNFFLIINVKMPTIVGIVTFMSRKNGILGLPNLKTPRNFLIIYTREHLRFHAQLS